MDRSPAKLAAVIVLGTFIGGAIGFYVRENWNLKGRVSGTCKIVFFNVL